MYGIILFAFIACLWVIVDPTLSYFDSDTFWHIAVGRDFLKQGVHPTAIQTLYGHAMPYVPHEAGFQLVLARLFDWGGWPGVYILTGISLVSLYAAMRKLAQMSRIEENQSKQHIIVDLLLMVLLILVYLIYFRTRPQMVSASLLVWLLYLLRQLKHQPKDWMYAVLAAIFALIAFFHAGVLIVAIGFAGLAIIEYLIERKWKGGLGVLVSSILGILLVPWSYRGILYFYTSGNLKYVIDEWKPFDFHHEIAPLIVIFIFIVSYAKAAKKGWFAHALFACVWLAGVRDHKDFLFVLLVLPYYIAPAIEKVPVVVSIQSRLEAKQKWLMPLFMAGACCNIGFAFVQTPQVPDNRYPVEEVAYIKAHSIEKNPRVYAEYGVSGYLTFSGFDVLADGRFDPFVSPQSKGFNNWTAFERSVYFARDLNFDELKNDHLDFVILSQNEPQDKLKKLENQIGEPDFQGKYGEVWNLEQNRSK